MKTKGTLAGWLSWKQIWKIRRENGGGCWDGTLRGCSKRHANAIPLRSLLLIKEEGACHFSRKTSGHFLRQLRMDSPFSFSTKLPFTALTWLGTRAYIRWWVIVCVCVCTHKELPQPISYVSNQFNFQKTLCSEMPFCAKQFQKETTGNDYRTVEGGM